jgi:hypothetical protein
MTRFDETAYGEGALGDPYSSGANSAFHPVVAAG